MYYWPLQDAKARLSEFIRTVLNKGPLGISVRGKKEVVVLSKKEYDLLRGKKPSFVDFINNSPLKGLDIDLERDKSLSRELEL